MQKRIFLFLALWTITTTLHQALDGQYTTNYTTPVQGSTINYQPTPENAYPGLPPTPLQNRFTQPLGQPSSSLYAPGGQASSSIYQSSNQSSAVYQPSSLNTLAPVQIVGQPVVTAGVQNPLGTLPGQQPVQSYQPQTTAAYQQQAYQQQAYRPQTGPVILNPVGNNYATQLPAHYENATYPYPGLVTKMGGKWIGSEYLYDIPSNIGLVVEVIKPGTKQINVDTRGLSNSVSTIFNKANIHPESLAIGEDPPLPFFHILIFVYPEDDKCTAAISGRLIEKVKISRLDFNIPGTTQAITWEKLDLIITSTLQFNDQLQDAVFEIVTTFVRRVQYFAEQKAKLNTGFKVQGCMQERVPEVSKMNSCDFNSY